jgi:pectinesterase
LIPENHITDDYPFIQAAPGSLLESIPPTRRVRVAKDGCGNYTTINDAVKNAPINQNSYFLIYIDEGTYEEYVVVSMDHPYLILAGAGEGKTIITGNRSNVTGWGTYYSATLGIYN